MRLAAFVIGSVLIGIAWILPDGALADDLGALTKPELMALEASRRRDRIASEAPRLAAVREAAVRLGAQHGFAAAAGEISAYLAANSEAMDALFDFGRLMRTVGDGRLVPPVVREAKGRMSNSGGRRLEVDGQAYDLVRPAQLSAAPPQWRDYFDLGEPRTTLPSESLLPRDKAEKAAWAAGISSGWKAGREQALREHLDRLARLKGDFIGMLTYWRLVDEGRMEPPVLRVIRLAHLVRSDELVLDRSILSIEADSAFTSPTAWRPNLLWGREEGVARGEDHEREAL